MCQAFWLTNRGSRAIACGQKIIQPRIMQLQYNNILAGTSRCQNQDNQLFNVKFGNLMR